MDKKILVFIGIFVFAALLIFIMSKPSVTGNAVAVSKATDSGDVVKIPLSQITEKADFHEYSVGGTDIEYFVVRDKNGEVKTAFNACDVCHRSKKGYRQEGDDMICNNCGNYYAIEGLGTKNQAGGGCWPGYLPSTIEGDSLVIKKSDLEKGKFRF
jgi:uncharacterized membrane protein